MWLYAINPSQTIEGRGNIIFGNAVNMNRGKIMHCPSCLPFWSIKVCLGKTINNWIRDEIHTIVIPHNCVPMLRRKYKIKKTETVINIYLKSPKVDRFQNVIWRINNRLHELIKKNHLKILISVNMVLVWVCTVILILCCIRGGEHLWIRSFRPSRRYQNHCTVKQW